MTTQADLGLGIVFELHNGTSYDVIGEVYDIKPPNEQAPDIDVTHYGSTAREFIQGLTDFGDFSATMNYVPGGAAETAILAAKAAGVARSHRLTWPDGVHTWTFNGIVKGWEITPPVDNRMTATMTSKVSGSVTRA